MKLSDFLMLRETEKKRTVLHQGVLISKRKITGYIVFLFQLHNFYVEAFCSVEAKGITEYRVFAHTELLQPYLDNIVIDDVFSTD